MEAFRSLFAARRQRDFFLGLAVDGRGSSSWISGGGSGARNVRGGPRGVRPVDSLVGVSNLRVESAARVLMTIIPCRGVEPGKTPALLLLV
eukprot:5193569-Pyramimonas_sp.AAC.1